MYLLSNLLFGEGLVRQRGLPIMSVHRTVFAHFPTRAELFIKGWWRQIRLMRIEIIQENKKGPIGFFCQPRKKGMIELSRRFTIEMFIIAKQPAQPEVIRNGSNQRGTGDDLA